MQRFVTNELIIPAPLKRISFNGKIYLINNDQDLLLAAADLHSARVLGFDTETKPSFKKGEVHKVALLQLATEGSAYLIRLHYVTQFEIIKKVFENENTIKVGVAIRDDLKTLQKAFSFVPKNFIELQTLAKSKGIVNQGLRGMTEEVLQATISKGPKMTNWEARDLSESQLKYAATDAWIGGELYRKLITVLR